MDLEFFFIGESAEIAKFHEIGTKNMPARPHLTRFLAENRIAIAKSHIQKNKKIFLKDSKKFLNSLGERIIFEYKAWILAGNVKPDLLPKTIEKKRKKGYSTPSTPLVASGKMINSLVFRIL